MLQFLKAKNTSAIKIRRQLTEVYGSDIMSVQMVRKWCREFCKGRHEVHDELRTGCPKVVMDESANTICALLNEDCRLTLRELETIMNDSLGTHFRKCRSLVFDGEVMVLQSVCTIGSLSVIFRTQNEAHGCRP